MSVKGYFSLMPDAHLAQTPDPPYYAVIFSSIRAGEADGYEEMSALMMELASRQPGFLGVETARSGIGITVSYWTDLASIRAWKRDAEHMEAQQKGRTTWYERYSVRIARVEHAYGW